MHRRSSRVLEWPSATAHACSSSRDDGHPRPHRPARAATLEDEGYLQRGQGNYRQRHTFRSTGSPEPTRAWLTRLGRPLDAHLADRPSLLVIAHWV